MSLSWAAPAGDGVAAALVEGTLLRLYRFDRFKSRENGDDQRIEAPSWPAGFPPTRSSARGWSRGHQRGP